MESCNDPLGLVGRRIGGGKYLVTDVVDETTFSIVYRATHIVWERPVAIKVFHLGPSAGAQARAELLASFVREGALLAELSETCAAICQARDIGALTTSDGVRVPYMVLEWLEGESLQAVISRERKMGGRRRTIAEVTQLLGSIAQALACAHARGVAHCDIKPGNIIVLGVLGALGADAKDDLRCKLLDFGVAKVEGQPPPAKSHVGRRPFTPAFGAPEQFDDAYGVAGAWTDVFALALTVVELLTGEEALQGHDVWMLAGQACDYARRPTPRTLGVDVGDEVEWVLRKALAVDPAMRFPDVGVFWAELVQAASVPARNDAAFDLIAREAVRDAVTGLDAGLPVSLNRLQGEASGRPSRAPARSTRSRLSRFPAVVALAVTAAIAFGSGHLPSRASRAPHATSPHATIVALAR